MSYKEMSSSFKRDIAQFLGGTKRTVAKKKLESRESLDEGKHLITYDMYNKLCEILFLGGGKD